MYPIGRIFPIFLATLLTVTSSGLSHSQEVVAPPFYVILKTALDNSDQIKSAQAKLWQSRERFTQNKAELLPNISLELTGNYGYERWEGGDNNLDPDSLTIALNQKIFDWKTLQSLAQTYPHIAAAERDLAEVTQGVLFHVIQESIGVLQAKKVKELSKENMDVTKHHLKATQFRQSVGELTRTELSRAQSRFSTAEAKLIRAEYQLLAAKSRWKKVVGIAFPENLSLPTLQMEQTDTAGEELLSLIKNRPDIVAASFRLQEAEKNARTMRADHFPVINLQSKASRTWDTETPNKPGTQENLSLAMMLSLPLYSGGSITSKTQEALFRVRERQADLDLLHKQAIQEIKQAVLDLQEALSLEQALATGVSAAKDALSGIEEEFKVGTRTSLDLLDAQHELFVVQTNQIENQFSILMAQFKVLRSIGRLSVQSDHWSETFPSQPPPEPEKTITAHPPPLPTQEPPQQTILDVVLSWAEAWSTKNLETFLAFYDNPEAWRAMYAPRFAQAASFQIILEDIRIGQYDEKPSYALFLQNYESNQTRERVIKTVSLVNKAGTWKIISERSEKADDEASASRSGSRWALQTSAHLSRQIAEQNLQEMQRGEYQPYLETLTDTQGRPWHMVRIGHYTTKNDAKMARATFFNQTGLQAYIAPESGF